MVFVKRIQSAGPGHSGLRFFIKNRAFGFRHFIHSYPIPSFTKNTVSPVSLKKLNPPCPSCVKSGLETKPDNLSVKPEKPPHHISETEVYLTFAASDLAFPTCKIPLRTRPATQIIRPEHVIIRPEPQIMRPEPQNLRR